MVTSGQDQDFEGTTSIDQIGLTLFCPLGDANDVSVTLVSLRNLRNLWRPRIFEATILHVANDHDSVVDQPFKVKVLKKFIQKTFNYIHN